MNRVLRFQVGRLTGLQLFALKCLYALDKLHLIKLCFKQLLLKIHQVVVQFIDALADDAFVTNRKQRLANFLYRFRAFHSTCKPIQHFAPQQHVNSGNRLALLRAGREGLAQ